MTETPNYYYFHHHFYHYYFIDVVDKWFENNETLPEQNFKGKTNFTLNNVISSVLNSHIELIKNTYKFLYIGFDLGLYPVNVMGYSKDMWRSDGWREGGGSICEKSKERGIWSNGQELEVYLLSIIYLRKTDRGDDTFHEIQVIEWIKDAVGMLY